MAVTWTDELKEKVIAAYEEGEPTPENSTELVKQIAEDIDMSPNGVRMVLSQAGVYVKKEVASGTKAGAAKKAADGDAPKRVSKEASIKALTQALEDAGASVDSEILDKLTGKAAVYFVSVLKAVVKD